MRRVLLTTSAVIILVGAAAFFVYNYARPSADALPEDYVISVDTTWCDASDAPQNIGNLTVTGATTLTIGGTTSFIQTDGTQKTCSYEAEPWQIAGTGTLTIEPGATVKVAAEVQLSAENPALSVGHAPSIKFQNVHLQKSNAAVGRLTADGQGFPGAHMNKGHGPGGGTGGVNNAAGAGYGGAGGHNGEGVPGNWYGREQAEVPTALGSAGGGGTGYWWNGTGGAGGGAIRLEVLNEFLLDGEVSSRGGTSIGGGAGSGGSIYISAKTLRGGGSISANGGDSKVMAQDGSVRNLGAGAGGRIAIYAVEMENFINLATVSADQGVSAGGQPASDGTVGIFQLANHLEPLTDPTRQLTVYKNFEFGYGTATTEVAQITVGTAATPGARLTVAGGRDYHVSGEIVVQNQSNILAEGSHRDRKDEQGAWIGRGPVFKAQKVFVAADSQISADGLGYTGVYKAAGNGPGGGLEGGSYDGPGAGYGGQGGAGGRQTGGQTYGDARAPQDLGSAGGAKSGYWSSGTGGAGGGAMTFMTDTLQIDGVLSANGLVHREGGGGGSGGSIFVTSKSVIGSGKILANGGPGENGNGPGGGGRIAVYYDEKDPQNFPTEIRAAAGGNSYNPAQDGTVQVGSRPIVQLKTPVEQQITGAAPNFQVELRDADQRIVTTKIEISSRQNDQCNFDNSLITLFSQSGEGAVWTEGGLYSLVNGPVVAGADILNKLDGGTYCWRAAAKSDIGAYTDYGPFSAAGQFIVDTTPPAITAFAVDPTLTNGPRTFGTWHAEDQTRITAYEVEVTAPDGTVLPLLDVTTVEKGEIPLVNGEGQYQIRLRATDEFGNSSPLSDAQQVTLDTTAPLQVLNPLLTAQLSQAEHVLNASWRATDKADVAQFEIAVGSSSLATDVQDWTAVGTAEEANITIPSAKHLPDGAQYFVAIRALDAAGNVSQPVASGGVVVDTTPPSVPTLNIPPQTNDPNLTVQWTPSIDATTGVKEYHLALGTQENPTAVADWTAVTETQLALSQYQLADGRYLVSLRAADMVGNTTQPVTGGFELDTTGPVADLQPIASLAAEAQPMVTWTAKDDGVGVEDTLLRIRRKDSVDAQIEERLTTTTYRIPTPLADGLYSLELQARDTLGNLGELVAREFVIDTTAPSAPSLSLPAFTNDPNLTVQWTPSIDATTGVKEYHLALGTQENPTAVADWTAVTETQLALSQYQLADGRYLVSLRAADMVGNTTQPVTGGFELDTHAPAVVLTELQSPTPMKQPEFRWTVTEAGSGVAETHVRLASTTFGELSAREIGQATSFQPESPLNDGRYTIDIRVVDHAGNSSNPVAAQEVIVDTTPPAPIAPEIPQFLTTKNQEISWLPAIDQGSIVASYQYALAQSSGAVLTDWRTTEATTVNLNEFEITDGEYEFLLRATDQAGNQSDYVKAAFIFDTQAPEVHIQNMQTPTKNHTLIFSWTGTDALAGIAVYVVTLTNEAGDILGATVTPETTFTTIELPDGRYQLAVQGRDRAGNTSTPVSVDVQIDSRPPEVSPVTLPRFTRDQLLSFPLPAATDQEGGELTIRVAVTNDDGQELAVVQSGNQFQLAERATDDGVYRFIYIATDAAGNESQPVEAATTLDITAPVINGLSVPAIVSQPTIPISWNAATETGSGVETYEVALFTDDQSQAIQDWSPITGLTATLNPEGLADGRYRVALRVRDRMGNQSEPTTVSVIVDTDAPTVSLAPVLTPINQATVPVAWSVQNSVTSTPVAYYALRLVVTDTQQVTLNEQVTTEEYLLTNLRDGAYQLTVQAIDQAGNRGPQAQVALVVDTEAPAVPSLLTPLASALQNLPTHLTWKPVTDAGSPIVEYRGGLVNQAGQQVFAIQTATQEVALPQDLPEGTYELTLAARDQANNQGAPLQQQIILDRTGPILRAEALAEFTKEADVALAWQLEEVGTKITKVLLASTGPKGPETDRELPVTQTAYQAQLALDGHYQFELTAWDEAGNQSLPLRFATNRDTTAPTAPAILTPLGKDLQDLPTRLEWTPAEDFGSGLASYSLAIRSQGADELVYTHTTPEAIFDRGFPKLPEGQYQLELIAEDRLGNRTQPTISLFTLDRTAPDVAFKPMPPTTNQQVGTVEWAATDDTDVFGYTLAIIGPDGVRTTTDLPAQTTVHNFELGSDGTYVFEITAHDRAQNQSLVNRQTVLLDTVAPTLVPLEIPLYTTTAQPIISWQAVVDTGSGVWDEQIRILNEAGQPTAAQVTATSAQPVEPLGDGRYTITLFAIDKAGNRAQTDPVTIEVDTTAPALGSIALPSISQSANTVANWAAAEEFGSGVSEYQYLVVPGAYTAEAGRAGRWQSVIETRLSLANQISTDGVYTLALRAVDKAGNISPVQTADFRVDATAPTMPELILPVQTATDQITLQAQLPVDTGTAVTYTLQVVNPAGGGSTVSLTGGEQRIELVGGDGMYELIVSAKDAAGNEAAAPVGWTVLKDTTPPESIARVVEGADIADDVDQTDRLTEYLATWTRAVDRGSGVVAYEYAIGTEDTSESVVSWTDAGNQTRIVRQDIGLEAGEVYYISLRARDGLGNVSDVTRSNGIMTVLPEPVVPVKPTPTSTPTSPIPTVTITEPTTPTPTVTEPSPTLSPTVSETTGSSIPPQVIDPTESSQPSAQPKIGIPRPPVRRTDTETRFSGVLAPKQPESQSENSQLPRAELILSVPETEEATAAVVQKAGVVTIAVRGAEFTTPTEFLVDNRPVAATKLATTPAAVDPGTAPDLTQTVEVQYQLELPQDLAAGEQVIVAQNSAWKYDVAFPVTVAGTRISTGWIVLGILLLALGGGAFIFIRRPLEDKREKFL